MRTSDKVFNVGGQGSLGTQKHSYALPGGQRLR